MINTNSMASMLADSERSGGQNDLDDSISVISDTGPGDDAGGNVQTRRRRWSFFGRGGDQAGSNNNDPKNPSAPRNTRALSITCRLKGTAKASCLITCSSIAELIGNLLALVYGIAFIQGAVNFYDLDNDPDKKAKEYDEKLDRVLFLQKNRVGFVGLLATCVVGLIVAFLMPLGVVYRSWKSLRAAMSLLFAMCLAHLVLAVTYLTNHLLMTSLCVIPVRIYEMFLIYNHISLYKKKKREEAMRALENPDGLGSSTNSQNLMGNSSSANNVGQIKKISSQDEKPMSSDMQLTFNLSGDKLVSRQENGDDGSDPDNRRSKERKSSKKRNKMGVAWQGDQKKRPNNRNYELASETFK